MKFSEKYPNAKVGEVIGNDALLMSSHEEPCLECGTPTRFIEYCSEGYFCSEECMRKFYDRLNECQKHSIGEPDNTPELREKSKIVLVEPGKTARIEEMELTLESMQKTVGGLVQAIYPWEDKVALVCNDEGKILEMPMNRALTDDEGRVYDIVCGTFFICGLSEESFAGLSDNLCEVYLEKFRDPQTFMRGSDGKFRVVVHHVVEENE